MKIIKRDGIIYYFNRSFELYINFIFNFYKFLIIYLNNNLPFKIKLLKMKKLDRQLYSHHTIESLSTIELSPKIRQSKAQLTQFINSTKNKG